MNVRNSRIAAVAAVLSGLIAMTSCQQFFTSSLAPFLARASYAIPADLPVADAITMLDEAMASGDTAMATALVTPLLAAATAAVTADPTSVAYQEAASALLDAVVLSSGVGSAVASVITTLAGTDLENPSADIMATTMQSLSIITLNADAEAAMLLLAVEPPTSMSADDAYTAAIALVADAYADIGSSFGSAVALTEDQNAALAADPSIAAATLLIQHAAELTDAGGQSMIGDLLPPELLSLFT